MTDLFLAVAVVVMIVALLVGTGRIWRGGFGLSFVAGFLLAAVGLATTFYLIHRAMGGR